MGPGMGRAGPIEQFVARDLAQEKTVVEFPRPQDVPTGDPDHLVPTHVKFDAIGRRGIPAEAK